LASEEKDKSYAKDRPLRSCFISLDSPLSDNYYSSEDDEDCGMDKLEDVVCNLFNDKHEVQHDAIDKILNSGAN
jgi:hypothetical protein